MWCCQTRRPFQIWICVSPLGQKSKKLLLWSGHSAHTSKWAEKRQSIKALELLLLYVLSLSECLCCHASLQMPLKNLMTSWVSAAWEKFYKSEFNYKNSSTKYKASTDVDSLALIYLQGIIKEMLIKWFFFLLNIS